MEGSNRDACGATAMRSGVGDATSLAHAGATIVLHSNNNTVARSKPKQHPCTDMTSNYRNT
jgi:hypothetical protein